MRGDPGPYKSTLAVVLPWFYFITRWMSVVPGGEVFEMIGTASQFGA